MLPRMDKRYPNLEQAKAFALGFTNMAYCYDSIAHSEFMEVTCPECKREIQKTDYLYPKASFNKPTHRLDSLDYGVSEELRNELIRLFDVTPEDFRPIRTKKGEIVFYQITPQHAIAPLHEENGWTVDCDCPVCGYVRYSRQHELRNSRKEPYFHITQEALAGMKDLNITFERFRFDMPIWIISRRLYDYLIHRFPNTHYYPFFLKEDLEA